MIDQWNLLKDERWMRADQPQIQVDVPADSIWFTGHFPGEPILPGIALVHLACDAVLREAREKGEAIRITSLKRIRFTGPVRPGDSLRLSVSRGDSNVEIVYTFKVAMDEQIVCTGQIIVIKS